MTTKRFSSCDGTSDYADEVVRHAEEASQGTEAPTGREQQLYDALRTYGVHHGRCAVLTMTFEGKWLSGKACDCGLMAALAPPPARDRETTS